MINVACQTPRKTRAKTSKMREIIKIRVETNKIESRKTIQKSQ
jgi:hypothetical protein